MISKELVEYCHVQKSGETFNPIIDHVRSNLDYFEEEDKPAVLEVLLQLTLVADGSDEAIKVRRQFLFRVYSEASQ